MTIQGYWLGFIDFLNAGAFYFVMQLGRGVFLSFPILFAVLLLRRTVFKKAVFLKGILWCLFLPLPFVGKMRFFYESGLGVRLFFWWHKICIEQPWIYGIWLLGILGSGIYIFYRRRKLHRFVSGLKKDRINDRDIYICDRAITPFTIGVLYPKIVMPEIMLKDFKKEEVQLILLHEQIHIRLGHLWCYAAWDLLRILLWVNPLLTVCTKYLREDLEEICDRVVIQRSRKTAYDYGRLLLNSIRILGNDSIDTPAAFAGERKYESIKKRMEQVARFKPYKRSEAILCSVGSILLIIGLLFGVRHISYPTYMDRMDISIHNMDFQMWQIGNQEQLQDVISFDDQYVYINRNSWNEVLREQGIEEGEYYVSFGGYLKLPGIGGGGNAVFVDSGEEEEVLVIPYYNNDTALWNRMFKML